MPEAILSIFNYNVMVQKLPIQLVESHFDSAIIDLPYGLYSKITPEEERLIIQNALRISNRTIIVSSKNILNLLTDEPTKIVDTCAILKV